MLSSNPCTFGSIRKGWRSFPINKSEREQTRGVIGRWLTSLQRRTSHLHSGHVTSGFPLLRRKTSDRSFGLGLVTIRSRFCRIGTSVRTGKKNREGRDLSGVRRVPLTNLRSSRIFRFVPDDFTRLLHTIEWLGTNQWSLSSSEWKNNRRIIHRNRYRLFVSDEEVELPFTSKESGVPFIQWP